MVTKAIVFCDRCNKEMKPIKRELGERYQPDFCSKCYSEFKIWMAYGKKKWTK